MNKAALLVDGSIRRRLQHAFDIIRQLSERIVSYAGESSSTFPYVTLPNWEQAQEAAREDSVTEIIAFSPLVEDFAGWRAYGQESNFSWIAPENADKGEQTQSVQRIQWVEDKWLTTAHNEQDKAVPVWQVSPFEKSLWNLDAISISRNDALSKALDEQMSMLGMVLPSSFWTNSSQEYSLLTPAIQPLSTDNGAVISFFSWQHWFNSSFQPGECFQIVLRNDQEQTFTFRAGEGANDTFQVGDHSDGYLGQYAVDFHLSFAAVGNATVYGFALVPCDSYYDQYSSSKPFAFAMLIATMVIIAGNAFNLYDAIVSQITKVILSEAFRAREVVEKLVPGEVRQRLFAERTQPGKQTFEQFMINNEADGKPSGNPVAELYPQATIMMADIAGFTSWSSTREPVQVFTLLEHLYGAFDEKATAQGVFKGTHLLASSNSNA